MKPFFSPKKASLLCGGKEAEANPNFKRESPRFSTKGVCESFFLKQWPILASKNSIFDGYGKMKVCQSYICIFTLLARPFLADIPELWLSELTRSRSSELYINF